MNALKQVSLEGKCSAEEKHQLVDNSIDKLEAVINNLENVIGHIDGEKLEDALKRPNPDYRPLSQFLNEAADDILRQSERINALSSKLKDMLF